MSGDTVQLGSNELAAGGQQAQADLSANAYEVLPTADAAKQWDLYSFRGATALPEATPAAQAQRPRSALGVNLLVGVASLAGLSLSVFAGMKLIQPKPPALYIDLGTQRFEPAGLGGRLIARWEGSPGYELTIDPLDEEQVARFAAVAGDPPHPLSVTIRLRDASGVVACQKQILFSPSDPQANGAGRAQALAPRKTSSGDTVQNVAGEDGRIAEIDITGGLPCPIKAYRSLVAWDFSTNFPTSTAQKDWLRHEDALTASTRPHSAANGILTQVQRLSGPVEGDDVIVSNHPSKGTVDTSSGQIFLVGASGLRNLTAEWQVFPAAIHFRCDENGLCVLTRANSHTALQARLLR